MNRFGDTNPVVGRQASSEGDTLDLRAYARPIWRWKWVVLAIAVLAAGGTYALTSREAKTYVASTQVLVQNADPAGSVTTGPPTAPPYQQQLQDLATLFTGPTITSTVYRRLGLPVGSAGSVAVSAETTSDFLDLTASSHSPVLAARLANTYAQVFLASQSASVAAAARAAATSVRDTLRTIPSTGTANQVQRYTLLAQLAQYDRVASNPSPGASVLGSAAIPSSPSSPRPARDAVFAGIIGLLLGIVLAFVLDLADRRLVRVSAVQSIFDRPVLAVLPHVSHPAPRMNGSAATPPEFVEAMRGLRVNLGLVRGERSPRSIIVTSGLPGEGKSTVARDLAFAYADSGERVLLIDCDLRRPSLARMFAVEPALGLVHVLRGEAGPAQAAVMVFRADASSLSGSTGQRMAVGDPRVNGSITLLAHAGHVENATAFLSSPAMTGLISAATSRYDVVILDTPPILTVSDAVPLLDRVDAVLFVARLGTTTREAAQRVTELGQRIPGMNLVGVVVNDMRDKYVDEGYSYHGRYDYGQFDATPREDGASVSQRVNAAVRDDLAN